MKIKILPLCLLLVVILSCSKDKTKVEKEAKPKDVRVVSVVFENVPEFVEATGIVQPDKDGTVKITARTAGVLQSINVQVGERVKRAGSGDCKIS